MCYIPGHRSIIVSYLCILDGCIHMTEAGCFIGSVNRYESAGRNIPKIGIFCWEMLKKITILADSRALFNHVGRKKTPTRYAVHVGCNIIARSRNVCTSSVFLRA
jgi:hypothetical protein